MGKVFFVLLTCSMFLFYANGNDPLAQQNNSIQKKDFIYGKISSGLKLGVKIDGKFPLGKPIKGKFVVRNLNNSNAWYLIESPALDYTIKMKDSSGNPLKLKKNFEEYRLRSTTRLLCKKLVQGDVIYSDFDISERFQIEMPGIYSFQISRNIITGPKPSEYIILYSADINLEVIKQ